MKNLILVPLLLFPLAAQADCIDKIAGHAAQGPSSLDLPNLRYFGAEHLTDPAHPQFAEIEKRWAEARPTIAYYEGPNRPLPATRDEVIRQTGESGFVRFLAARDQVPIASLEPSPKDEMTHVMRRFTPEQTVLFYALREAARLRERQGLQGPEIAQRLDQMLARFPGLPIKDSNDLALAYQKYWKQPANWWEAPRAWFDPARPSSETGGVFTNEVNAESSRFRDVHMAGRLAASAREPSARVFAVVGRNHVFAQAEALRCLLPSS